MSTINHHEIQDIEIMISFDVQSLFTGVAIESAAQAALRKPANDFGLAYHTTLTPEQIAEILNFVPRSTCFQYNEPIYEQLDGIAMGSPVSAVRASLYMREFEGQAIPTAPHKPEIWKWYIDDTFTNFDGLLQH